MSFLQKALATIGIGAAKIDTRLSRPSFRAGEKVEGTIMIMGGNVDQEIDTIFLSLLTNYTRESNERFYHDLATIDKIKISEPFTVLKNEIIEVPFTFPLALSVPVTLGETKVWVKSGADIKHAVDPSDEDTIIIKPSTFMSEILESILSLGFKINTARCLEASSRIKKHQQYVQEFVFEPTVKEWIGKIDDLEVIFFAETEEVYELMIEVNRKSEKANHYRLNEIDDESIVLLRGRRDEFAGFQERLKQVIDQYS